MLVDEIRAALDADEPRLVFADACAASEPERGELVALQCAVARGGMSRDDAIAARRRVAKLLGAHGARWAGLDGLADSYEFARGFVDRVTLDAAVLAERGDELFEKAPALRRVDVTGFDDRLADRAALRSVRVLGLGPMPAFDAVLDRLAAAGVLRGLTGLVLRDAPPTILGALAHAGRIGALAELELAGTDAATLASLASWFAPVRLRVRTPQPTDPAIPCAKLGALARSASELSLVREIAALPPETRAGLRSLGCHSVRVESEVLASDPAFGGLDELAFAAAYTLPPLDRRALQPLAYATHLRPRVLRIDMPLDVNAIDVLGQAPIAERLEVIDIRGRWAHANRFVHDRAFAGIVLR